ncbi:glycosyltransferase family 39 protein [Prosthecobacter sp.]|uniref:glycosyltransferase family 39 protein n=1 Tax=Prosthecobacter sp. TaxID=1965333 RepID=UPI002ABC3DDE|nr:glycosyltransferase family 39 protein [Prosthecobacter sp.]MDZ4405092.1 glycosyltransferase family 39 protein [Prosthecobacter sp.]
MLEAKTTTRRLEFLLLGGTLLFYIAVTLLSHRPDLIWDEGRYLWFAKNLTQGSYITPEKPDLINGPGYPLVLAGLLMVKTPLLGLRMFNAVFMALAAWFSFRSVLPYAGKRWALGVALVTALHPSLVRTAPFLMTEALAVCCIAGFAWAFTAALRAEKWNWLVILAAAFALAWLTLSRVFFGNVIMASMGFLVLFLPFWKSQRTALLRAFAVLALAFAMCAPWLAYTKAKTGDTLCWSTNGGELLYWATSTHEGENGHWFSEEDAQNKPELVANGHRDFYKANYYLPVKEREAALKKKALENIRANPKGVLKNWLCNWGRLIFGFPRSYQAEELIMLVLVAVNGPLLLVVLVAVFGGLKNWHRIPPELLLLTLMLFIYLGGTSLLPGLPRYTVVVWPWIGLGMAAVLARHLRLRLE